MPAYGMEVYIPTFTSADKASLQKESETPPAVAMVLCEGEGLTSVFPETEATHLDVVLNVRKYVAAISRHAAGTATIQGTAYAAAEK
jgi:hypothetical protein